MRDRLSVLFGWGQYKEEWVSRDHGNLPLPAMFLFKIFVFSQSGNCPFEDVEIFLMIILERFSQFWL
jgi:hypothetical protein